MQNEAPRPRVADTLLPSAEPNTVIIKPASKGPRNSANWRSPIIMPLAPAN